MSMKKYIFLIMAVFLFADEIQIYGGKIKLSNDNGIYKGVNYKSHSEDETIIYKIGLKKVNIFKMDIKQTENFFSIKKETDLDKHLEFVFQDIHNDVNNGNIYILNWYKTNKVDYKIAGSFSNYDKEKVYQISLQLNSFIYDTPFYIVPTYYSIFTKNNKNNYNSLSIKLGYIKGKNDVFLSFLGGKNKYLVTDDKYYSCNFGYITKYAYKFSYSYQLNLNYIVKLSYYNYKLVDNDLKAYNLAISYRY